MVVFNVVVLICICMEFFAKEEKGAEGADQKEKKKEEGNMVQQYDAAMLRGWYAVEVLMFCATIISNIVFVLARACSRIRILGTRTTAIVHSNTDMIEE